MGNWDRKCDRATKIHKLLWGRHFACPWLYFQGTSNLFSYQQQTEIKDSEVIFNFS
ncbi:MAG TPA: hypothetical protein VK211_08225 [Kamptonema sp.]|nr:hypothetical protein [Kamptonema sp.]